MGIAEKLGYVRGLADGLDIKDTTPEGRLLLAIVDLLGEMAEQVLEVGLRVHDIEEGVDDLITDVYGDETDDGESRIRMFPGGLNDFTNDDDDDDDEDGGHTEEGGDPRCVSCGCPIGITPENLRTGSVTCPSCNQQMTLEIEGEDGPCGCGGCGHPHPGGQEP